MTRPLILLRDEALSQKEWERVQRHRERDRQRYHSDPKRRAAVRAAAERWNKANPERFNELKREWYRRRYANDPEFREKELASRRDYAKRTRAARPRIRVAVASLHSLRCTGPTRSTGCRCSKVMVSA